MTCEENRWSRDKVAAIYAQGHDGADIRLASMRDIEAFRKSLFARSDHELREQPPGQPASAEPAPAAEEKTP